MEAEVEASALRGAVTCGGGWRRAKERRRCTQRRTTWLVKEKETDLAKGL
jgi:hypothetical protein